MMKSGLTIQELAAEILRQKDSKEDYIVSTRRLQMEPSGTDVVLRVLDENAGDRIEPLDIGPNANPELLTVNVNSWFERSDSQRMLRVLDGKARAFLSNRYLRLDHLQIAEAVLPIIGEIPDARFESCQITEDRMYIKEVNHRLQQEVVPGDIVQAGVIISNSEVGLGSVNIQPLVYRLVCKNGMVVNDAATRRNHVGRINSADENFLLYSAETLAADDHAFMLKIQDTVRAAVGEANFSRGVGMMREAAAVKMNTANVPEVVRLASRDFGITDEEHPGVLQHLIEGKDLTLYGLANAVTRYSQDVENYDRASKLEEIGYQVMTMSPKLFQAINQMQPVTLAA